MTPSPESNTIPERQNGGVTQLVSAFALYQTHFILVLRKKEKEDCAIQPVVRPEAYSDRTAWMATYMAGTLKVSNMI